MNKITLKSVLKACAFVSCIISISAIHASNSIGEQLVKADAQIQAPFAVLGEGEKSNTNAILLDATNHVSPLAFGDSYSLAPVLKDNLDQYYWASTVGAPTTHTFNGSAELAGNNYFGSSGGYFVVTEGIIPLGGGVDRYAIEIVAMDSTLKNYEPWVDATWSGQGLTGWVFDVGTLFGGTNQISPGFSFSIQDSGFFVFNSASDLLGSFELSLDSSTSTSLAGSARISNSGNDIAGVDVAIIQMYWDILPVSNADLALQLIDTQNGIFLPGSLTSAITAIQNIGESISGDYSIDYYISADAIITTGDRFLGYLNLSALDVGESEVFNLINIPLPGDLANGDYYIGAILNVSDTNATNNVNHDPEPITISSDPEINIRPLALDFEQPVALQASGQQQTAQPINASQPRQNTLSKLADKIKNRGKVELIVGLNIITQPQGKLTQTEAEKQHQEIRASGDQLARELRGLNAQIRRQFESIPFVALTADQAVLDFLAQSPRVASISEDTVSKPFMASSNAVIGSPLAWAEGYDGSGWAVAVLDTGVDNTHSWFTTPDSKVVAEACYGTNVVGKTESFCPGGASSSTAANSGLNCDLAIFGCDHGTHVAGTVAGNDEIGPNFGVARGADIIAMQVFSKFLTEDDCGVGQAPCTASFSSDQIAAMERVLVLADSIDIASINMSLGGGQYFNQTSCDLDNAAVKAAIDNLRSVGIATIIATGNDGWTDSISAPGCISSAISVGATADNDDIAYFSNIYPQIHLLAPGVDIDSSVPGNAISSFQGTSMATPHIAGAWAVMKQLNPGASVSEVLTAFQNTATLVDDLRYGGIETGMPRINLDLAIGEPRTTFGIFNDGPASLSVTSIAPGSEAPWISWSPAAPFTVEAGELKVVSVFVDYDLAPAGTSQIRLLVNSNDPDESPYPGGVFVNVNKTQNAGPEFFSTPAAGAILAFGDVAIGSSSSPAVVSVENLGDANLTLSCSIIGVHSSQFKLLACPSPVPATGSTAISIACEPSSTGSKQASLKISTNDADEAEVSYSLTCAGIEAPSEDMIFSDGFEGYPAPDPVPDLVVVSPEVSLVELNPDQAFTVAATAHNQGDGAASASTLRYYLSDDNVITTGDTLLGVDAIPELSPGSDSVQNLVTSAPAEIGAYWVGACVDAVVGEINTGNQCSAAAQITVVSLTDSDGDRLSDSAETNTGVFINANNTGTDPNNADTDGDGIKDGDEVLGTLGGLDLPAMGVNPLRKDLLLEYDWFSDDIECGAHSHRPTAAAIASAAAAFSASPVSNPGITGGVNLVNDYGQGGAFTGGNQINDANGVIDGGVNGAEYLSYKAANFASNRNGYFHYVLLLHNFNTNSTSSGQAELPGDDLIVSLQCFYSSTVAIANTIVHEVGHNLNLRHGGNENCNYKPNYNSVMNYAYQFPGIDNNCTPPGDGVLSYSTGDRIQLNENNLNENNGTCGPGYPWDWNNNASIQSSIILDVNLYDFEVEECGNALTTLNDYNDWGNLFFGGLSDADGAMVVPREIITEQPVPVEFLNVIGRTQ